MDWHARYTQQANWTGDLRHYLFEKAELARARRALEVGCGTGAILAGLKGQPDFHGLDIDPAALAQCRVHAPGALLTRGDALSLPYRAGAFDVIFCHFLLLWVRDPLRALLEMKRVTRPGGHVLVLAEPDYTARVDQPEALAPLGRWQTESLRRRGADPSLGGRLGDLFSLAGIEIVETGPIQGAERATSPEGDPSPAERQLEWAVLESDLAGSVSSEDLQKMKSLDEEAWARGDRRLQVPTYFAWGKIC
jgi:SAM-dependent methyltransferase